MRPFRYVICDVFTDTPLQGNQLAVFTDATDLPEAPDGQFLHPRRRSLRAGYGVLLDHRGARSMQRLGFGTGKK